ncbi:hypothetical protein SDC9_113248 [bioreactor metagenome]|uniref:Uncharacterized protein n=1 Tax=bioreactor metagenome TaxID=1076179 RepID=A0A645BP37_9ZZZZ
MTFRRRQDALPLQASDALQIAPLKNGMNISERPGQFGIGRTIKTHHRHMRGGSDVHRPAVIGNQGSAAPDQFDQFAQSGGSGQRHHAGVTALGLNFRRQLLVGGRADQDEISLRHHLRRQTDHLAEKLRRKNLAFPARARRYSDQQCVRLGSEPFQLGVERGGITLHSRQHIVHGHGSGMEKTLHQQLVAAYRVESEIHLGPAVVKPARRTFSRPGEPDHFAARQPGAYGAAQQPLKIEDIIITFAAKFARQFHGFRQEGGNVPQFPPPEWNPARHRNRRIVQCFREGRMDQPVENRVRKKFAQSGHCRKNVEDVAQTAGLYDQDTFHHARIFSRVSRFGSGCAQSVHAAVLFSPVPGRRRKLFAESEAYRQPFRQSGVQHFVLRHGDIIGYAIARDRPFGIVIDGKRGPRIAVARLPDAADIEKILAARLDLNLERTDFVEIGRTDSVDRHPVRHLLGSAQRPGGERTLAERHRDMGMTAETELRQLIGKVVDRVVDIKDITPGIG